MPSLDQINIRDPFVLLDQDTYYLYGTRSATCWGSASGFDVYTSDDLISWSDAKSCFENDGTFWADRNYWAPEVHKWNGGYYMFASFRNAVRRRGTAILRADVPAGHYVPWSDGPVTPAEWECLDGTFYTDTEGRCYMIFCHEWVQAGDGEVWAMPLTADLKRAAGDPALLFRASEAPWVRKMQHSSGVSGFVTDGPFIWRDRQGRLLCLWSSFSSGGYTQGLAVSDDGSITSHFSQLDPLFENDGGHGMLFRTKQGRTLLSLHTPNEHLKEHPHFCPVPAFL